MTDTASVFSTLDYIGRGVAEALLVPSLEALILGMIVWCILRIDQGFAPWIRHLLWLTVILKPMMTLILPWEGPFPLPWLQTPALAASSPSNAVASAANLAWMDYLYAAIAAVWGAAILSGIVWILTGVVVLYTRMRGNMPVPVPWIQALFVRCLKAAEIKRPVRLAMSDHFASPTLIAIGQPVVVVPSWCLIQLSPQELRQVFLHELMHYARRDHWTLLVTQISRICFFFHPWVWYAGRRLAVEAERACDMAVVAVARKPRSYAASLVKVAEGAGRARWRGVLELARSVSITTVRVRDILTGFDQRRYAVRPYTVLALVACGLASLLPFFYMPVPQTVLSHVRIPSIAPLLVEPVIRPPAMPSELAFEETAPLPAVSLVEAERPHLQPAPIELRSGMTHGIPYARSGGGALFDQASLASTGERRETQNRINPSRLGLPSPSSSMDRALSHKTMQWGSGQIEVQSGGRTFASDGFFDEVSVRAGYFVTKTHELGGVLSVMAAGISPGTAGDEENITPTQIPAGPLTDHPQRMATRRIAALPPVVSASTEANEEAAGDQTLMIGGFYRYNLAGLSTMLVPFVGVGAGVEVRAGRNPVLVDGGAGVRCFFSKHAALIVQMDYVKDVELSTRSRVNASLGISTIF